MNPEIKNIAIIGSSSSIGSAFEKALQKKYPESTIHTFSRKNGGNIDYTDENSIQNAANIASKNNPLDLVIVTNGILHYDNVMPEKSLKELSSEKFHKFFEVNTIVPALIAKYFLPKLNRQRISKFAALSARIGSISGNELGGWYSYRASKSALNMIIKNAAIEIARFNKTAVVIGLHPGTVDSNLSKPFQKNVPKNKLFTPEYSANKLLKVIEFLKPTQTGKCFAWDGQEISP